MAEVISMINWKGGVGKSTMSLHLGVGLMRHGADYPKVLLIDLDPQSNLSYLALGIDGYIDHAYTKAKPTLKNVFDSYFEGKVFNTKDAIIKQPIVHSPGKIWKNVDLLPSHHELVLVDMRLAKERKSGNSFEEETRNELDKMAIISRAIAQIEDEYDYIILDCPPNINLVTQNSFFASKHYLVPAIPDFLSTVGISLIKDQMSILNKKFNSMIQYSESDLEYADTEMLGIVFNMVDEYGGGPKSTHAQTISDVSANNVGMVLGAYITDGDGISVASENNLTAFSYDYLPRAKDNARKQSGCFDRVCNEILSRF